MTMPTASALSDTDRAILRDYMRSHTKRAASGCLEWTGARDRKGYGRVMYSCQSLPGQPRAAHRLAVLLANGRLTPGMLVCHRCDNPPCCDPSHLFEGTAGDNSRDASAKGRLSGKQGLRARSLPSKSDRLVASAADCEGIRARWYADFLWLTRSRRMAA